MVRQGTFESRLKFPVCKLIDRLDAEWQDDHTLPVWLARAQMAGLRTAGDPEGRGKARVVLSLLAEVGHGLREECETGELGTVRP
jgi:hypothetical protein